jgi:cytoskeletal protein RodZ
MQNEETAMIPFFAHESAVNRLERMNKRLLILLLVIFIAFVGTNAYWIWFESQFEDTVVTQDVDTGEGTAVLSGTGDVFYGTDTTDSKDTP